MCLVTSIPFITLGPKASGVTYIFPNPTTKTSPCLSICSSNTFFSSLDNISAEFSISLS